ncbi:hypothetical protein HXX01_02715 [Candidatus Nomurabacteria bacterium]|nr:hypothetical protein [Candidatus Nomurabacteria bacterium]
MKKIFLLMGGSGNAKTFTFHELQSFAISHFSIGAMYRELSGQSSDLGNKIKGHIDKG